MRNALLIAATSLLGLAACNPGNAQDDAAGAGAAGGADMAGADAGGAFADQPPSAQGFARAAAMSDLYEIAAARLAIKRTESTSAREFAQMMIADHSRSSKALKDAVAASGQTVALPDALDTEHQTQVDILKSLNGPDFEREYLTQQMAAHRKALGLLKAYAADGDVAELRQFAQGTIPAVQTHADWLEKNTPIPSSTSAALIPAMR